MPTRQRIRERAFELYRDRGAADGCDLEDWLVAERELFGKFFQRG